ncbi:MAG: hypothetical protein RML40_06400 [Bacteroidota bacterium]|nr:hypothetical protein [Candidatus Kapabacteria bacterium]MDW8220146.1 hypothetical protein [Bacteroidota bacterium]
MRAPSSRSFAFVPLVVCVSLALSLWLYASMREEYTTVIDVPLEIRLPAGKTLETEVQTAIRVQVQGPGWQLISHFLSSAVRCIVYLSERQLAVRAEEPSSLLLSRQALVQAIQAPVGIKIQRVMTDSIPVLVGSTVEKRVPVRPVLYLQVREGFILAQSPTTVPDSITIRGSRTMLQRISHWNTAPIRLRDVYEPMRIQTSLSDTLYGVVYVPQVSVVVTVSIQQMAEMKLEDIPVQITGAPARHSLLMRPQHVDITVRGGINTVAALTPEHVHVALEYNDASTTTTGTLRPRVTIAVPGLRVIDVQPQFIRCVRRIQSSMRQR